MANPTHLDEIIVFSRVVEAGSFTRAARELDMPKSTVSRKVSELEERLGARLLQRTTRKLSLTDVGRTFFTHAARVAAEVEAAELAVSRMQEAPRGRLRVTTPLNFGYLSSVVATFLARYPEVQLEMVCADRVVDLVQEGFDVAVRAGRLSDSTLIARYLGVLRSFVVATPALLARHGTPREPEDLARIPCVIFSGGDSRASWTLRRQDETRVVPMHGRFIVNDFDLLDEAARAGIGVAMLPVARVTEPLRRKQLVRVLPEWWAPEIPLHAVYASTRHLAPKVSAFIQHLDHELTPQPWERGPVP